ncbi:hypothetical protein ABT173_22495 [Streptomyces sp. NPDC001795]|uniref:hypothetical protein n=1 Tax=Streptomyces sp. NPDC001795 TaxID=3154525 RepID=UPI003330B78D
MSSPHPGTVELALLRGWLRGIKGTFTYATVARRASDHHQPVSERTLRRAVRQILDGRLPALRVVVAFTHGAVHARAHAAGASRGAAPPDVQRAEQTAHALWEAAGRSLHRRTQTHPHQVSWVPGHITTQAGLARAMRRLRQEAGNPSLRALATAPEAAGQLSRSALQLALNDKRLPSEQLLTAFAAACHASEPARQALLAARRRITGTLEPEADGYSWAGYPCAAVEQAEARRADETARPWLTPAPEPDFYDQQLRAQEQAADDRMTAWIDSLTADEIEQLQQQAATTRDGHDLRAELTALLTHTPE